MNLSRSGPWSKLDPKVCLKNDFLSTNIVFTWSSFVDLENILFSEKHKKKCYTFKNLTTWRADFIMYTLKRFIEILKENYSEQKYLCIRFITITQFLYHLPPNKKKFHCEISSILWLTKTHWHYLGFVRVVRKNVKQKRHSLKKSVFGKMFVE